jgi:rod shape determining protein RodA
MVSRAGLQPGAFSSAGGSAAIGLEDNQRMSAVFDKPSLLHGLLAFAVFLLACAGLLIMYSSGFDHGTRFVDHGRNMLIAGVIMFVVAQIPPQRLMALAVPLYVLGVSLLVAVAVFGITKKGARRWLNVGVVIQPSEILKIAMPLMLAWWFQKREGQLRPLDFIAAGLLLLVPVGLIMKQPDLGTSLLVLAAGLAVIFFAGLSWKLIAPPVLLGLVAVFLVVWFEPQLCADGVRWPILHDYQQQRIPARLPAAAHLHAARSVPRPAGQGLSHHPGNDRHRLGRRVRQGLHGRYADAP